MVKMFLKPDFNLKNIYEIDLKLLKKLGIKAIFFDLDSTLMKSKSCQYSQETQNWLKEVDKDFFIAVISNNKSCEYINKVKSLSSFQVFGNANKPSPKLMRKLIKKINMTPKDVAIVGDRPLTDILAGKLLGATTVLVDSINADHENMPTRVVRKIERMFII
jgi:HAD superfamily phosphatase (TIGR01668 family)